MLGEIPGSGQPNRHTPGLPKRSRNGAADTLLHQDAPPPAEAGFPPVCGPGAPILAEGLCPGRGRRQPHLAVELDDARRRWEALPLTREGS